ncbi:gamma-interferon-inducible lysosomal thiol reductase-like protein [Leptinotarsa decemlineata]|uniref:gamma-interferon-inducible lysosomal thiol reductase-like protein n=1 Tax=Leptinotarsa decemlineata TaxID=7539 RepID=UPI003D30A897
MWFLLVLSALFVSANGANPTTVSVYYETLCPACVYFFKNQLGPAYYQIGDKIKVDLLPYGNSRIDVVDGKVTIICQHGESECYGNRVQACALDIGVGNSGIEFVLCAMNSSNPVSEINLKQCAIDHKIDWDQIEDCSNSGKADNLLIEYAKRTNSVSPPILGTPTIALDNHYVEFLTEVARTNLQGTVKFFQSEDACYWCNSKKCH